MKILEYNQKTCKSYKDFYEKICEDLALWEDGDLCGYENLHYNADLLNEFLWGVHNDNILFRFIGYDKEKIVNGKTSEAYEWGLIFKIVERFCKNYPNNKVEFIEEK